MASHQPESHQTVAANRLDPNVSADGNFSSGPGVGAQDEAHVKKEGIEHIKDTLDGRGATSSTTGTTSSSVTPASNPGYDNSSAGIASGAGESQGGIIGTVKNILGFGGETATTTGERKAEDVGTLGSTGTTSHSGTTGTTASSYNPLSSSNTTSPTGPNSSTTHNTTGSNTSDSYVGAAQSTVASAGATAASALGYGDKTSENTTTLPDRTKTTGSSTAGSVPDPSTDGSVSSSQNKTSTGAVPDPSTDGSVSSSQQKASTGGVADPTTDTHHGPRAEAGETATSGEAHVPDVKSGANPKSLEHPEAIPTAGGEKLGQKHWGESKIVPENPKPLESETAGVSSSVGQPTGEVAANTSRNTGGATSGPHGQTNTSSSHATSGEKESLTDKIKDKLHIGGSK